jgi:hypothetical protein
MEYSPRFLKISSVMVAASTAALVLFACGEKTSEPKTEIATEDAEVQVTAATIPILYAAPLVFSAGVPELGTTTATTLTFTANDTNAATPVFNVKSGTDSASGVTTFGSCIFTVTRTTYSPPTLQMGAQIEIEPCEVNVATGNKEVGVDLEDVTATFTLGNGNATPPAFDVKIEANGDVVVILPNGNEVIVGEVDIVETSGAVN